LFGRLFNPNPEKSELKQSDEKLQKFVDLAPTDQADKDGTYTAALLYATNNPRVSNIALTGPYGSGKSSIIRAFLKRYQKPTLEISLAAFVPDSTTAVQTVSTQEIERSILQQMLYGADANSLPLSRFKRIRAPRKWSALDSLFIVIGLIALWYLLQSQSAILDGSFFEPFAASNWFNFACFLFGTAFAWRAFHYLYVKSLGVSLKSVSLNDIEITPEAADEDSILNRHLDEIIYFFQSTNYELVIVEDLDRFNNPEIFVTLREINSLINANKGVSQRVRFLYALRDNIFKNTDRTKFFEFIVPVIPIINSSNSIDKVLEQGTRLALDERLDRQFLREVSRYLDDLRLIQNIFNEYVVYVESLDTDGEEFLDANKLLAVLIYKNVFPSDFEELHRGKGKLADILNRHDEYVAGLEAAHKAEIAELENAMELADFQMPRDQEELRKIYAMTLIQKLPPGTVQVGLSHPNYFPVSSLTSSDQFETLIGASGLTALTERGGTRHNINVSGLQAEVDPNRTYAERAKELLQKSKSVKAANLQLISQKRKELTQVRTSKFSDVIRQSAVGAGPLFDVFEERKELARFLVFEGYLDDSYYQYTSLFHSGRLSPSDNKFLILIRGFSVPEPDFQIDNPKEVIEAMRDEDFEQKFALNVRLVDNLVSNETSFKTQKDRFLKFVAANYSECENFFGVYYQRGTYVAALLEALRASWPQFLSSVIESKNAVTHAAQIIANLPLQALDELSEGDPEFVAFVSEWLPDILELEPTLEAERLKTLNVEVPSLEDLRDHAVAARTLAEHGLYALSVSNIEFVFEVVKAIEDMDELRCKIHTTIIQSEDQVLLAKIKADIRGYLGKVAGASPENTQESREAILDLLSREEVDEETIRPFLAQQSSKIEQLTDVPERFRRMVIELRQLMPSWSNCMIYLSMEEFDAGVLTSYLEDAEILAALAKQDIPEGKSEFPLREFLIGNNEFSDDTYQAYVRLLPNPFNKLPDGLTSEKHRALIEERKVTFGPEIFSLFDYDEQVLFVAENFAQFLKMQDEFSLDDDFRENLLRSEMADSDKMKVLSMMDPPAIKETPDRAALVGKLISRSTEAPPNFDAETVRAIILNSQPVSLHIRLLNKLHEMLSAAEVSALLQELPRPLSEIKRGYGWSVPRLEDTDQNLEFAKWLKRRRLISSWSKSIFGDIRLNLFRK